MIIVRQEKCIECGAEFTVTLEEFIKKTNSGMNMPKRCKACRKKNRDNPDKYKGIYSVMRQYPLTKGHRHVVHGGAF